MNCRLAFTIIFFLSCSHVLNYGNPKGEKKKHEQSLKTSKEYHECKDCIGLRCVESFALNCCIPDHDEKQFKEELKQHKLSIPESHWLRLLAKDLKEKSKDETLSPDKRVQRISASLFLDRFAQEEAKSWLRKKLENHLYRSMTAIIIMTFAVGFVGRGTI